MKTINITPKMKPKKLKVFKANCNHCKGVFSFYENNLIVKRNNKFFPRKRNTVKVECPVCKNLIDISDTVLLTDKECEKFNL